MTESKSSSSRPVSPSHGRVAELSLAGPSARIGLYVGPLPRVLRARAAQLEGLAPGDLVEFSERPAGELASIRRLGGAQQGRLAAGGDALRWRQPAARPGVGGAPSRMALLELRGRLLRETRKWFEARGFLEADTPALARAPSPEAVFEPFGLGEHWLITSPEFQLKRMLVGGFERLYRLGPVFRAGEAGAHHNPEFTLLEWYRAWSDTPENPGTTVLTDDLESLLGELAPLADQAAGLWPAGEVRESLTALSRALRTSPWRRASVAELFAEHLGMDIAGITDAGALAGEARRAGAPGASALTGNFTAVFSALWINIEQALGPEPLLITHWPAPTASLARLSGGDPSVAERIELYAGGLELANGFAELTDAAEQRRRFAADLEERRAKGLPTVPLDQAFLAALAEGMPPAAGMALGVDRLAMLLSGAPEIRHVLPLAWDEL